MMRKPTRTISGVAPLAVMLPPRPCPHGACLFCPQLDAPQSYTPESPVVLRAKKVNYDAKTQVINRLSVLKSMGHLTDKIELIIMGGTFLSYPEEFQFNFIKACYDGLNGSESESLEEAQQKNEQADHRCVALCIETRPDWCSEKQIQNMRKFGCTRVELGVQALDDKIYELNERGHTVKDVILATKRLKLAGFKVGYHLMPGLPGSSLKKDLTLYKKVFASEKFRPDQVKIYPCQVLKGSGLEELYRKGKYKPYTEQQTRKLLIKLLQATPRYCRVMRILREIPPAFLVAGTGDLGLRAHIEQEVRNKKIKINEIRFREIGFALRDSEKFNKQIELRTTQYAASGGKEYFIEAVNKDDLLFGLLRLRIEKSASPAIVRELHVYGPQVALSTKDEQKFQHRGLGKQLMEAAEKIVSDKKIAAIKVISGAGVRDYYRSLGYVLDEQGYMSRTRG